MKTYPPVFKALCKALVGKVERASHVDFDETRLMTSAVSDTGYWLAEATGDDVTDVFDAGRKDQELHNTIVNPTDSHQHSHVDIQTIQNILSKPSTGDPGDVGAEESDPDEDVPEVSDNSLETHLDPSTDGTYTSRPKRS